VVFLFRVEDLQVGKFFGGDEAEKQKLLDLFNKEWKALPVVKVSVIIISPDLKHDNAMVQHIHDKVLIPWLKQHVVNPETFTAQLVFSDGGPAHYKLSDHVFWISTQKSKHDIHVRWNFMAPGHGKTGLILREEVAKSLVRNINCVLLQALLNRYMTLMISTSC